MKPGEPRHLQLRPTRRRTQGRTQTHDGECAGAGPWEAQSAALPPGGAGATGGGDETKHGLSLPLLSVTFNQ